MENIIKVDQAMKSLKRAILKTDDAIIIEDSAYLCDHIVKEFHDFLTGIQYFARFAESPLVPDSALKEIDDLVAEILLKQIRPGKDSQIDNTKHVV